MPPSPISSITRQWLMVWSPQVVGIEVADQPRCPIADDLEQDRVEGVAQAAIILSWAAGRAARTVS